MTENTKKLMLKDMPENEAVEIFKTWCRGDVLEGSFSGGPWCEFSKRKYQLDANVAYRIPTSEPSFDNWHMLPEWARFIAQDENGCASIFESEPTKVVNCWDTTEGRVINIPGLNLGYDPGTGGWENSMVEKPEVSK